MLKVLSIYNCCNLYKMGESRDITIRESHVWQLDVTFLLTIPHYIHIISLQIYFLYPSSKESVTQEHLNDTRYKHRQHPFSRKYTIIALEHSLNAFKFQHGLLLLAPKLCVIFSLVWRVRDFFFYFMPH